MTRATKLKVFRTQMGFYDAIVAVPSKKAALAAWGTRQDLFRDGAAIASADSKEIKAATARAGVVLRRPLGSKGPFGADALAIAAFSLPRTKLAKAAKASAKPAALKSFRAAPADRSNLLAAERALEDLEAMDQRELDRLERQRADLDAKLARAKEDHVDRLKAARSTVLQARRAYRKAGGQEV